MADKKITLADVDGTIPGRAALVSINLDRMDDEGPMYAQFVEGEYDCTSPWHSAEGIWQSVKDDFPGHTKAIIVNERANYLRSARQLKEMFGFEETPEEYLGHLDHKEAWGKK